MTTVDGGGRQCEPSGGGPLAGEADILADVGEWELSAENWSRVGELLGRMRSALGAADRESFTKARDHLETHAPPRIGTRIGEPAAVPVPEVVREHLDRLVHDLQDHLPEPDGDGNGVVTAD
ncbi:CATRA system-associated protein [Streptomyces sp. NPDC048723]|uniref:CATRA system-associated protein n=1 Tax=Streptomyces sp. NPDC048723 TaxID=3365589 RepID=UPI00371C1581